VTDCRNGFGSIRVQLPRDSRARNPACRRRRLPRRCATPPQRVTQLPRIGPRVMQCRRDSKGPGLETTARRRATRPLGNRRGDLSPRQRSPLLRQREPRELASGRCRDLVAGRVSVGDSLRRSGTLGRAALDESGRRIGRRERLLGARVAPGRQRGAARV
jgi:hypothetical protein